MGKKDVNLEGQRVRFSRKIKRKVLLEVAKGKRAQDVFLECIVSSLNEITSDKKYVSKLLYKWRKELYENKEFLCLLNHEIDNKMLMDEIKSIGDDAEEDISLDEAFEELKENLLKMM